MDDIVVVSLSTPTMGDRTMTTDQNGTVENPDMRYKVVLVVDYRDFNWRKYRDLIHSDYLQLFHDTNGLKKVYEEFEGFELFGGVHAIVIQGKSYLDYPYEFGVQNTYYLILWFLRRGFRGTIVIVNDSLDPLSEERLLTLSPQVEVLRDSDFFEKGSKKLRNGYVRPPARELIQKQQNSTGAAEALRALDKLEISFGKTKTDTYNAVLALVQLGVSLKHSPVEGPAGEWLTKYRGLLNLAVREAFQDHPERHKEMLENLENEGLRRLLEPEPNWFDWFTWPR